MGCDREGRAVTIIFKEEETCGIKSRKKNGGGSVGGGDTMEEESPPWPWKGNDLNQAEEGGTA